MFKKLLSVMVALTMVLAVFSLIAFMPASAAEASVWDGFHKVIYYGNNPREYGEAFGCFEIWKHELDAT